LLIERVLRGEGKSAILLLVLLQPEAFGHQPLQTGFVE